VTRRTATARQAPAPIPTTWEIVIEGRPVPLAPRLPALMGIEKATGRTIYQHVQRAAQRATTMQELTVIVRFLAGSACPVEAIRGPAEINGFAMPLDINDPKATAVVLRSGLIPCMVAVTLPLMAAVRGAIDEEGEFLPGWDRERLLAVKD
jgi:hypothetical protein